jgi:alkylation response protein AidB-like acyl-CoA dehydrogenase
MISFAPTEDELLAKSTIQDLARSVLRPAAADIDRTEMISDAMLAVIWKAGLTQFLLDGSFASNGGGRSRILSCLLLEELGWADTSIAVAAAASMAYAQAILDHGSIEQQRQVRSDFTQDQFRLGLVLVQEPGFGFDVGAIATSATRDAQGYVICGDKSCVPLPSSCRDLLVLARCEGKLAAFLLPVDTQGVFVRKPSGTLGLKGLAMTSIRFENVRVPHEMRLGGDVGCDAQALIDSARTGICAILAGLARAVIDHIVPYTKSRVAHGSALAQKQSVAFRLADMSIAIPSMRWMTWQAGCSMEKGRSATRESRLAQLYCTQQALWIADEGVQLMGGHGYMRDNPVERWFRDAHTLSLLEGIVGV